MSSATTVRLRPAVLEAREKLAAGRERLRKQHDAGSPGVQVCALQTDLIDQIVMDLYQAALADLNDSQLESHVALVPHGGYGRRDLAPYSDVDLMLLYQGSKQRVSGLARRLAQDICDSGLQLGFSFRTAREACSLSLDATIFTALAEARYLAGSSPLFAKFMARFRHRARGQSRKLIAKIREARREERQQYGGTVHVLRPNIKRSRGGLRDLHLIRWLGFARFGDCDLDNLMLSGALSQRDRNTLREAHEFLLRVRNEMHFHAGKSQDLLDRPEQVRLAELRGYCEKDGLLPVEQFMRDFFARTNDVCYNAACFVNRAVGKSLTERLFGPLVSHNVERDFRVGPRFIGATRRGLAKVCGDIDEVLRLMELSALYDKRIDDTTWLAIRDAMQARQEFDIPPKAAQRFLSILARPPQLGELLRRLYELGVLEKLVPPMGHARGLVQFNDYHKYTVDEHSLRAVECALAFRDDEGLLGEAYRSIREKRILHLALLLHDLGKGYPDDHSERGAVLAQDTCAKLRLPPRETEIVVFLVRKHLMMSHLAQWRDINDPQVVAQFAAEVGSPDVLQMLYVLTCADVAAVGPGVLNDWKRQMFGELYQRTRDQIAGDAEAPTDDRVRRRRDEVLDAAPAAERDDWLRQQVRELPRSYLLGSSSERILDDLQRIRARPEDRAVAWGRCLTDEHVEYTIAAHENLTPGIFHKLTGALTSNGHTIYSAEINTLPEGRVLDRFVVTDVDYSGKPTPQRLDEVSRALVSALKDETGRPPTFRRVWSAAPQPVLVQVPTRVQFDASTSERFTIIDIFTRDRQGLLYAITRTIFELGLSVHMAKIATYAEKVVDVFYVSDNENRKITDPDRLTEIQQRLLAALEEPAK